LKIDTRERIRSVIHDAIIETINKKEFKPGDRLPSEEELAEKFEVSRNSIRDALASLEQNGIIIRRQGIGTTVAPFSDQYRNRIDLYQNMFDLVSGSGHKPGLGFNQIIFIEGPTYGHLKLNVDNSAPIVYRERTITADRESAIYIQDYFDPRILPNLDSPPGISGDTIDLIEKRSDYRITYLFNTIKAVAADPNQADKMSIAVGNPLLNFNYDFYDDKQQLVLCAQVYFNSKLVDFNLLRVRDF